MPNASYRTDLPITSDIAAVSAVGESGTDRPAMRTLDRLASNYNYGMSVHRKLRRAAAGSFGLPHSLLG
jgi:hypothetical protein